MQSIRQKHEAADVAVAVWSRAHDDRQALRTSAAKAALVEAEAIGQAAVHARTVGAEQLREAAWAYCSGQTTAVYDRLLAACRAAAATDAPDAGTVIYDLFYLACLDHATDERWRDAIAATGDLLAAMGHKGPYDGVEAT